MRVITGTARGRRLRTLEGTATRPTADRVKEGLFSALQFELEGRRVLDLFAGSGQLGIEAMSRGAGSCVFVDSSREACDVVRDNLQTTGLSAHTRVICSDAADFLRAPGDPFDMIFLDPPYGAELLVPVLSLCAPKLRAGGVIACEYDEGTQLPECVADLKADRSYRYGRVHITLYRKEEQV